VSSRWLGVDRCLFTSGRLAMPQFR